MPPIPSRGLMQGDRVEYSLVTEGNKTSARIERVIERACAHVIGVLERDGTSLWIATQGGDNFLVASRGVRAPVGNWVVAEVTEYPTMKHPGEVSIIRALGEEILPEHDNLIALIKYGLPHEFSKGSLDLAEKLSRDAEEEVKNSSRIDLREDPFVTIDGADAKDFDDAVLVKKGFEGHAYTLFVAIADVSFFVRPHSPIDTEAVARGTSIYFPATCIPMLPERLSNDLCSLRPKEDKLVMVAEISYDREFNVEKTRFYEAIISTHARLTYKQVQGFFDREPQMLDRLKDIAEPIKALRALYRGLNKLREKRGVLDFNFPETWLDLDEKGEPIECQVAPRWESHRLIEEFMVTANSEVARALKDAEEPTLYRVHEPPNPEKLDEINGILKGLGFRQRIRDISPKAFGDILKATKDNKAAGALHERILRLQKQAVYAPSPLGHFGLALDDYAHFTSPIRRYPDLVVHRSLKQLIESKENSDKSREKTDWEQLGKTLSSLERRAVDAERFVVRRKECWLMRRHLGETFTATVSGAASSGLFMKMAPFGIDGFVSVDDIGGSCSFDEEKLCIVRKPDNQRFTIGDEFEVQVAAVSVEEGRIRLIITGGEANE